MGRLVSSALELIGDTPLVRLRRLPQPGWAAVLAKLESANPSGSVKDRVVLAILEEAEAQGRLKPGDTIVEASAGNTALALALVAAVKGYRVVVATPEGIPQERRRLLMRFGVTFRFTNPALGMEGAQRVARELAREPGHLLLGQFQSPATPRAHAETTARELLEATEGRIDAFVAGVGTGGTITGVGRVLKQHRPDAVVVAVEPARSPLLSQGRAGEHGIPGLGADFIPPMLDRSLIDEVVTVSDEEAAHSMARLAAEEGLLVGVSSGANVFAALAVAQRLGSGKTVVTILPDIGERYAF